MRRTGSHGHDIGFGLPSYRREPGGNLFARFRPEKEFRRCTIRGYAEVAGGGKVALRYRPAVAVAISLAIYQQRSRHAVFGIGSPTAGNDQAEGSTAQIVMEIEAVAVIVAPELGSKTQEGTARGESEHQVNMRVVAEERNVLPFREYRDTGTGVRLPDGPQQRRREENIPDGAEANRQNVGKGGSSGHGLKVQRESATVNSEQ